ncbi:MAG: hydrogenase maturation protease [Kiritimatiellae bacterium]|nr:hydrogenase maturation protease [Kiritimatiellia bacterium]
MRRRVLVIGYGNPGRLDDGLGPACAEALRARAIPGVTVESNYQLVVEDAAAAAGHDAVVFVDATVDGPEPFAWRPTSPHAATGLGSHTLDPGAVLELTRSVFHAHPEGWILAIRGYEFDRFGERLSPRARENLDAAIEFLDSWLRAGAAPAPDKPHSEVVTDEKETR